MTTQTPQTPGTTIPPGPINGSGGRLSPIMARYGHKG
jgi:hypothetical protein